MKLLTRICLAAWLPLCWLAFAVMCTVFFLVASGRMQLLVVHGSSMNPVLYDGDLAVAWRSDSYRVGDVVSYKASWANENDPMNVLHRIVRSDSKLTIKGDSNAAEDPQKVDKATVRGKLIAVAPQAGAHIRRLQGWTWILCLIAAATLFAVPYREDEDALTDDQEAAAEGTHWPTPSRGQDTLGLFDTSAKRSLNFTANARSTA